MDNIEKIDVIVLAGGLGTRLRSVVSDVPKPLALINNRPFLDLLFEQLNNFNQVRSVILAIGYKAEHIIKQYENNSNYNFEIQFSLENSPLGTGGAIKKAISKITSDDILVMNGDSFVDFDLNEFRLLHDSKNADITFLVQKVDQADRYSTVEFDSSNRKIKSISKKSEIKGEGYINAGCYLLRKNIFDTVSNDQNLSFEDEIFPDLLGNAYCMEVNGKFIDIGTPESYSTANTDKFWDD